jgi:NAD(P)H dehydrogenase (quinone)
MSVSLIIGHPRRTSFCHGIAATVAARVTASGREVAVHDLYAEQFDPILTAADADTVTAAPSPADPLLQAHRDELREADGLVVVHPNWWGKPPAVISGWIDRVFVPGVAYKLAIADGAPLPLLRLSWAVIINTGDTPLDRERTEFGDPLDQIWRRCLLPYCGVPATGIHRRLLGPVAGSTPEQRARWLTEIDDLVTTVLR